MAETQREKSDELFSVIDKGYDGKIHKGWHAVIACGRCGRRSTKKMLGKAVYFTDEFLIKHFGGHRLRDAKSTWKVGRTKREHRCPVCVDKQRQEAEKDNAARDARINNIQLKKNGRSIDPVKARMEAESFFKKADTAISDAYKNAALKNSQIVHVPAPIIEPDTRKDYKKWSEDVKADVSPSQEQTPAASSEAKAPSEHILAYIPIADIPSSIAVLDAKKAQDLIARIEKMRDDLLVQAEGCEDLISAIKSIAKLD